MTNAVIVGYLRSPFQLATKGELARVRPDDLCATVVAALVQKTGIEPKDIEDVLVGCAFPEAEQGLNVARLIAFLAKLPQTAGAATINRFCGSSMQAIHMAAGAIALGAGDVFVCAGVESMTRVPLGGYNLLPNPALAAAYPQAYVSMGITAENVAKAYGITRMEQQEFAIASHAKALKAREAGLLTDEIVPVGTVKEDGCIRPGVTQETLDTLKPAFLEQGGSVTAGTSSPLTDGAAATLVTSEDYARAHGLPILARIRSVAVSGCAPEIMGIGPVEATRKALARANLSVKDLDIVELNEAFASQSLAVIRDLGLDPAKINLDGGAIALGHPLGATGARITGKAAALLKREGKRYALATQCIGGGQGIATILEAV